jgi:Terminase RNaseH-like domain
MSEEIKEVKKPVRRGRPTKEQKLADSVRSDYSVPEIKELLKQRGIEHPYVLDVVIQLAKELVENKVVKITNKFFWLYGYSEYKRELNNKSDWEHTLTLTTPDLVQGELLNRAEIFALWDLGIAPYEPNVTFEEFLSVRLKCKQSAFYLGKTLLERSFAECHQKWTEHFPSFDPLSNPPLPSKYDQTEMNAWLAGLTKDAPKNYLLLASRNAFKSSYSHMWLLTAMLACPDLRILIISETQDLSKDFISTIKNYFLLGSERSRFQRYFPEFCFNDKESEGKANEVISKMARLNLTGRGVTSTSQESSVAGKRAELMLFDDFISNKSSASEVQRNSAEQYFYSMLKLRATTGICGVLGTPWHTEDVYAKVLEAAEKRPNFWRTRIDPAWKPKVHALGRRVEDLRKEDVDLLFPEHLTWDFLQDELAQNKDFFMSQNLCIFPKDANWNLKVTFDPDLLNRQTRNASFFTNPLRQTYAALDRAYSVSSTADYSAIVTGEVLQVNSAQGNNLSLVVTDVRNERLRESELVEAIGNTITKHRPKAFILEKDRGWEVLVQNVKQYLLRRNYEPQDMPQFVLRELPSGASSSGAKAKRIKKLEAPLADGKLWFLASRDWTTTLLEQLEKYEAAKKSNITRKDDICDALSLLWDVVMPKSEQPSEQETQELQRSREEENERMKTKAMHERMFSGPSNTPQPTFADVQTPQPQAPGMDIRGARKGMINRMLDSARKGRF